MLRVQIDIPRPIETLCILALLGGAIAWCTGGGSSVASSMPQSPGGAVRATVLPPDQLELLRKRAFPDAGGPDQEARTLAMRETEDAARRIRMEQAVLNHREEILRFQLRVVQGESARGVVQGDLRQAEEELLRLLDDQRAAEERFRETLRQLWEAEGVSAVVAVGSSRQVRMMWPVEPVNGLSAVFLDAAYEARFGIPHHAIDIPVEQGSPIHAAADGVVERVVDNGMGYSYLVLKHEGVATLYGHVSAFAVVEGQEVRQGEIIASSGGLPGTRGAGALTTGPHVHFEMMLKGARVDPLTILPPSRSGMEHPASP